MVALSISNLEKQFPDLLRMVQAGEEIILEKAGKPIAKIIPFTKQKKKRVLGKEKGKIWMSDDFTAPLPPEMLEEFYK